MNDPSQNFNTVRVRLVKRSSGGLGVSVGPHKHDQGLVVAEVINGGEAERTGYLRLGDLILQVNDRDLSSLPYEQCLNVLQELKPDEMVTILVRSAEGYATYLHTTFNDKGTPHTIRVSEVTDPNRKSRRESNPGSPRRSPALTRVKTTDGAELGEISCQNETAEKDRKHPNNPGALPTTHGDSPDSDRKSSAQGSTVTAKTTSPDRPQSLSASNRDGRKGSVSSPSRRPVRLHNITTGHEDVESLVLKATEPIQCCQTVCMGSLMSGPPRRHTTRPRPKEEVLHHAKQFFDQYFSSIKRFSTPSHARRWKDVVSEVESTGTYELKETELVYGAKVAWRNAPRCIGRIQWSKLQVFDARYVTTSRGMFEAICNHIKYATNKGNIRSAITIFPQRTDGLHDFRVWNPQLIMYAGYLKEDGTVVGDPANVDFTQLCMKLGWEGQGKKWDILPLVLSANGRDPQVHEIPEELILRVPITHPKYDWFKELDIQWYAVPAVSGMLFDVGGIEFPGAPFNGWYMVTEIGSRDLCDSHRFNILEEVAKRLGVDTRAPSTLWKDRAAVEINYAVLSSFQNANVTIVDHHTASESFMKHWENEMRLRGGCPADWVWIVPPMSSSLTQVFHQEMLYYNLKPSYEYQDSPCKTHVWEKDREKSGNGPKIQSKKFRFKEIARAVKFSSNLFSVALSRRIKATILYATETGKSEHYAKTLGEIFSHAFNVNVTCMADYDIINLEHEALLLAVTSTFGNGDPPENGEAFARSLQAIKVTGDTTPDVEYISNTSMPFVRMNSAPLDFVDDEQISSPTPTLDADIGPLSNVRFSVFALGSCAYPNFCSFGRYVDNLLGELGGERLVKIATGDELCGQEHSFSQWAQEVFKVACDVFCVGDDVNISDVKATLQMDTSWSPDKVRLVVTKKPTDIFDGLTRGTSRKPVPCIIQSRTVLHSEEDQRETLFVELSPVENRVLKYLPGDHVGIYPANRKELVDGILSRMLPTCPDPDQIFRLELRKDVQSIEGITQKWVPHDKMPCCSLRTALYRYLDITTPPGQQFLRALSTMTTDENDKRKIMLLATDSSRYEDWKSHLYPNILEVLEDFPSVVPTPAFMMYHLPSLQPRFYSISSAPDYKPGFIHLTVAVIQYETQTGSRHYGVCSNYLATNPDTSEVACFVRGAPNFRLPDSPFSPVIMIGPGTGIAPFRSFWQQRHLDMMKRTLNEQQLFGNMTLLVGCRRPTMELYREESQKMKQDGVLTAVYTAYSRVPGKPKRYVQHILREHAAFVYQEVVEERGHFYVCGDVSMAEDVNRTLRSIIQEGGNLTHAEADTVIKTLQEENRYHEDIFGITLKTAEVTSRGRAEAKSRQSTSST